jgi:hypothetical protein
VEDLYHKWKKDGAIEFAKELYKEVFGFTFLVKDPDGHVVRVSPEG